MSRADQSLSRQTPKTCSAKSSIGTGFPCVEPVPTTNPTSASISSVRESPYDGVVSLRGLRCPLGRTTGVPETTTVPARP
jgi:hypothetical protein